LTHKFPTSSSILEEHEARHFATVCWHTYACYLSTKRGKTCEDRVHYLVVSEASTLHEKSGATILKIDSHWLYWSHVRLHDRAKMNWFIHKINWKRAREVCSKWIFVTH
jgi:hypothetical protein